MDSTLHRLTIVGVSSRHRSEYNLDILMNDKVFGAFLASVSNIDMANINLIINVK